MPFYKSLLIKIVFTILAFLLGIHLKGKSKNPVKCTLATSEISHIQIQESKKKYCCSPMSNKRYIMHKNIKTQLAERVYTYNPHPKSPVEEQFVLSMNPEWQQDFDAIGSICEHVYMTRSPTRTDQETKCVAVIQTRENHRSLFSIGHRNGSIHWPQVLTDQYQEDWITQEGYTDEKLLIAPMIDHLDELIQLLSQELGSPIDEHGNRRTATIMVANEGVIDLIANFICSCRSAKIDISHVIVFVAQKEYLNLIKSFGIKAFYHEYLGHMPKSSKTYADDSFSRMMWFKASTVYLVVISGWNVLFQDADLVWLKDPIQHIKEFQHDMVFMDDGIRSPRFSPFFINSGFYYFEYNPKTIFLQERFLRSAGEISFTHSHQQGFIRHITETHYLFGMQIQVLDRFLFPSGHMYHHEKAYMKKIITHDVFPYVYHMNFNDNREQKISRFAEYGMWFLPPLKTPGNICETGKDMFAYYRQHPTENILDKCCVLGGFWETFSG